jgi:cellulose synthase/poly-beta-1,6-N-acetylglucosamine synthase-like glycosyltransferase
MFRAEVLRNVGVTDRTKVEDLDLTWTLVSRGYRVRQASRCIVYPQECSSVREEWRRWRRWIVGYAVCMRLHWRLLFSRFGLFSILPMFVVVLIGIALHAANWLHAVDGGDALQLPLTLFPMLWVLAVGFIGLVSAIHHRRLWLVPLAPLAVVYVLLAYAVWAVHGVAGLVTGREPKRDKPTRHAHVVA